MKDGTSRSGTKVDTAESLGLRLSVSNFGPIAKGVVDLRPLTVFVGPSNSGKTYFATLVYALYRILGGMARLPVLASSFLSLDFFKSETIPSGEPEEHKKEIQEFLTRLDREGQGLKFSDLPENWRRFAKVPLNGVDSRLGADLKDELGRCFDLNTLAPLIRWSDAVNAMEIALTAREADQVLWKLRMHLSDSDIVTKGHIEDIPLRFGRTLLSEWRIYLDDLFRLSPASAMMANSWEWMLLIQGLFGAVIRDPRVSRAHYLPAARSGIVQSHRMIASSLVNRATRAGWQRFPEIPTFSGVIADFIARLILHEDRPGSSEDSEIMEGLARVLEENVLEGAIRSHQIIPEAYPEFVYQPQAASEDIRLTRASSMVSELAPIVLLLREAIRPGDLLVIEEPEAHLHPAAQTRMAHILGRMVRAGLKVVITTHSDWLLQEIGNLIREGELHAATTDDKAHGPLARSLEPHEVGAWLFRKNSDDAASTVEEIPFDRIEGIEPREYEDVAEVLYNRSADLQNQLEALGK